MFQALRFRADATCGRIGAALSLHPAHTLAIVFPLGVSTAIAQPGQLEMLFARAARGGKEVTIVGGDAALRAQAVAVGFSAAVTLDDWKLARHQQSSTSYTAMQAGVTLAVVEAKPSDDDESGTPRMSEPPTHVVDLLDARELRSRISRPLPPLSATELDIRDAEAVLLASEVYEDSVTARIRDTSGLGISWAI